MQQLYSNVKGGVAVWFRNRQWRVIPNEDTRIRNENELRRCWRMCYLVAKKFNDVGCLALQMTHGQHLVDFKERLMRAVGMIGICLP